jgi:protein-disulfide isomerase
MSYKNMLNIKNKFTILSLTVFICAFCVVLVVFLFLQQTVIQARNANQNNAIMDNGKSENSDKINTGSSAEQNRAINSTNANFQADDHVLGNTDAQVKIIIYEDFECPYCARFYDVIEQARKEFGDKLAISMRHFPLTMHENAMPAAIASECAAQQGKFWEMYDRLFAASKQGKLNDQQYKDDAKAIGLDIIKFSKCQEADASRQKVVADMAGARTAGLSGAPAFFVNGTLYRGAYPYEDNAQQQLEGLKTIIKKQMGGD